MGDSKAKSNTKGGKKIETPTKQDVKTFKSPGKSKVSTPAKVDSSNDKNKKTPNKESSAVKKAPNKGVNTNNKTPVKESDKKSPVKSSNAEKKTPSKESGSKKTPVKEPSSQKKTPVKEISPDTGNKESNGGAVVKRSRREGLPLSRVKLIMKTARYAEAISPDAVTLTAIATEMFLKYLMKNVHANAVAMKKKRVDYNSLANYVNNDKYEHLEFLRVIIPHKITVAEYKKLMAENLKNTEKLDFLVSESEDFKSEEESDSEDSGSEEESDSEEEDGSDVEEIPTPQKTVASLKKKNGLVEIVDLCGSSSEEDFIILDQKKKSGKSSKRVIVL